MGYRNLSAIRCLCLGLAAALTGCAQGPPQAAPADTPVVPVSQPVSRQVTEYVEYTGRTDAVQAVDIRPRVTGYLTKIHFQEGAEVKAGDRLFEIDPRPYRAQHDQAQSQVSLNDASLELAQATYERDRAIANQLPGSVSKQQLDQDQAAVKEAKARVQSSRQSEKLYKLNVDYTSVTAPIDGRISRYYLTLGNLVNQDQTLLTTVVSEDSMHAYFDMDEPTLLFIRTGIIAGRIRPPQKGVMGLPALAASTMGLMASPVGQGLLLAASTFIYGRTGAMTVFMGLQGEDAYPHQGTINFVNNQLNPSTGSISVRGVFSNPKSEAGVRLLSPGMFVRIRLPMGQPHAALLIIDRAIQSDQGLKFVYVVDAENKVQYRRVTTGTLQDDGLRVISDGLKPDDWVVIGALQQLHPRTPVQPERTPMPSLARPTGPEAPAAPAPAPKPKPAGKKKG